MQNSYDGISAINSALSSIGESKTFVDTVFDFGKAAILSDQNKSIDVTDEICFNQTLSNNGYNFEGINLYNYGPFYYLADSVPLQNVGNNYAQLRKSTDTASSQTWTMSLPNSLGKYTISGNFAKGETVYVVFTGLNTSETASNVGQIAFTGITANVVKNLVGPHIIDNDKRVIDYGIIAREEATEALIDKWNIKESATVIQKSISSGNPGVKFEIIVKNSSGIYDKTKSQLLESTMVKTIN